MTANQAFAYAGVAWGFLFHLEAPTAQVEAMVRAFPEELAAAGVTPIAKSLHVDLAQAGYAGVQKVEGLALLDDGRLAVLNDNDFGVARIVIDTRLSRSSASGS